MLSFAGGASRPALRLLVVHDDAEREFDYMAGAEEVISAAQNHGWTAVSIQRDWKQVFPQDMKPVISEPLEGLDEVA